MCTLVRRQSTNKGITRALAPACPGTSGTAYPLYILLCLQTPFPCATSCPIQAASGRPVGYMRRNLPGRPVSYRRRSRSAAPCAWPTKCCALAHGPGRWHKGQNHKPSRQKLPGRRAHLSTLLRVWRLWRNHLVYCAPNSLHGQWPAHAQRGPEAVRVCAGPGWQGWTGASPRRRPAPADTCRILLPALATSHTAKHSAQPGAARSRARLTRVAASWWNRSLARSNSASWSASACILWSRKAWAAAG